MSDAQTLLTYQKFVDEMVSLAKQSVSANRIGAHGHSERANDAALLLNNDERSKKNFCENLSKEQRITLVQVLIDERVAAIHDVLAYLEWAVSTDRLEVSGSDGSFAHKAQETMHGDYISRLSGYEW